MWSSRPPPGALQQTPRTEFRAPEHLEELSSSLQGPSFELPNTSRSSHAASQDRMPSSRTSRGAGKQPPRNEFRAPKQASQEESKQRNNRASKQANNRASKQAIKRANERKSKRVSEQTSKRAHDQTNKKASKQARGRRGAPKGLQSKARPLPMALQQNPTPQPFTLFSQSLQSWPNQIDTMYYPH